jgi:endoglucanase
MNLVLVPGNAWTGANSWVGSGSAEVMLRVVDPADHFIFEVHQYLDGDSSGTHASVVSRTIGSERLRAFTLWCRTHHKRAFLGEFGAAASPAATAAIDEMLTSMEANADVWTGFTWWAAGPWWGDYMFSIEPKNGRDRPQLESLRLHLQPPRRRAPGSHAASVRAGPRRFVVRTSS